MAKNYYDILGVNKNSSAEEIKKAYRKMAHEHHPDKASGNEAKFKEVNEAYQVLSDTEKRQQYDQYGQTFEDARRQGGGAGAGAGGFGGGMNWQDFAKSQGFSSRGGFGNGANFDFSDLGDMFGFGDIFGGGRSNRGSSRGNDIELEIQIEFDEAIFGAGKEIKFNAVQGCDNCGGNGAEKGAKIITCRQCNGSGRVTQVQRTFLGNFQTVTTCPTCQGQGKQPEKICHVCGGQGAVKKTREIKAKIPAGIDNGQAIRLSGQGEVGKHGSSPGDLYIRVKVKPSKKFARHGFDIFTQLPIKFSLATLGGRVDVDTVYGKVTLKIPSGTQTGKQFKLSGSGVEHPGGRGKGDHIVEIVVETPTSLNGRQKKILEQLAEEGI